MNEVQRSPKVIKRRLQLRSDLLDAARVRMSQDGLHSVRARDLATDVGCSLGAIYNVFHDIEDLIFNANALTLRDLGVALSKASETAKERPPADQLTTLADAYMDFCIDNPRLWTALFAHRVPKAADIPDWYKQELDDLIERITAPLRTLRPDLQPQFLTDLAQGLFASTHGILTLGLQSHFFVAPHERVRGMIHLVVRSFTEVGIRRL